MYTNVLAGKMSGEPDYIKEIEDRTAEDRPKVSWNGTSYTEE
jgi:hypothetical protein